MKSCGKRYLSVNVNLFHQMDILLPLAGNECPCIVKHFSKSKIFFLRRKFCWGVSPVVGLSKIFAQTRVEMWGRAYRYTIAGKKWPQVKQTQIYTNTQKHKYTNTHIHKPGWRCEWGHYCEHKVTPFAGLAATFCLSSIFTFASLCSEDDSLAARASSCFHWLSNLKTWNLLKGTRFKWLRYRSVSSGFPIKANNLGQPLVCMLTSR